MPQLYLIPNHISDQVDFSALKYPIKELRLFFVEEAKSARKLLKSIDPDFPLQECAFHELNEHSKQADVRSYLQLIKNQSAGIISESGCPCVADPGADLVLLAHEQGIDVIPLIGPSSILLALMGSGLGGQNFAFVGYLPKDEHERIAKIKLLELRSQKEGQTQIIMETPYRNQNIFEDLCAALKPQTLLCIASDLTGSNQFLKTQSMAQWRKMNLQLPKLPTLFIIK